MWEIILTLNDYKQGGAPTYSLLSECTHNLAFKSQYTGSTYHNLISKWPRRWNIPFRLSAIYEILLP